MKHPQSLRIALIRSLLGSALLATPLLAITPSEFDSLRAKADRGNAIAQYNLGLAHADRRQAIYDPAQAYAWLSLAATNGTNGKALSDLTSLLTAEQLTEGKRRLALLSASPVSPAPEPSSPIVDSTPAPSPAPSVPAEDAEAAQKKLSAELAAAWKENELLKAGLTAQLADANKRVAIAEAALTSKDKEIAALQQRVTEATATPVIASAPTAPIGLSAELASLRTERDELQNKANTALAELSTLRAQTAKASGEQAALKDKLANTTIDLASARRAQTLAEAEIASLKASADRASAERLAVAAHLETATVELAAAKAAPAPAPVVAPVTVTADPAVETLTARLAETQKALETATQAQTAAQTALAAKETALAEATAELAATKSAIPATPTPAVVIAPLPAAPAAELTPALDPETAAKLADLEKTKAETDDKLAASLRSFTLQQAEIDRLQKSLAGIDEERAATAAKLDAANTELATLRPQAASTATVSADAEVLRAQLAAANQTLTTQSTELTAANRALTDARGTIDTATADLIATRDQLRQTQAQSAAFAVENQQLKTRLALAGSLATTPSPSRPGSVPSISINLPPAMVAPVAPPPAAPAVASPAAPRVHTVAPGDSLSKISKQYYGTAGRWNDILQANQAVIRNPDALALGTKLRIP